MPHPSPYQFSAYETQKVKLEAYDNQYIASTGYTWVFNDSEAPLNKSIWEKRKFNKIVNLGNSYIMTTDQLTKDDNGASFVAYLKKICNVNFLNNFIGVGNGGTIKVNGQSYSSPTTQFQVVKGNQITAEAEYYYFNNGIEYIFQNWSDNSTSRIKTFIINSPIQITAN